MSRKAKRKLALMFMVEVLSLFLLGRFLMNMQTNLSLEQQKINTAGKLAEMDTLLRGADYTKRQLTESYDDTYKSQAGSIAFMFQQGIFDGYTTANMLEAKNLLNVDNVLILDTEGNVVAKALSTSANFTYDRFNQLRTVFTTGEPSAPFNVITSGDRYRYYGARIDDGHMVVLQKNPSDLQDLLDQTVAWESILSNVTIGLDGFTFAVSMTDYTFLYYPDSRLVGLDALGVGITADALNDGRYGWMTVDGKRLYCGVTELDGAYVIGAVTEEEILASRDATVALVLFVFFAVMTLVITYAFFIMEENGSYDKVHLFGKFFYNRTVGHRIMTVSMIGLLCILVMSYYVQTIFSMSRQSMTNSQRIAEVEQKLKEAANESETTSREYGERFLNKAQIAAYIIDHDSTMANRELLAELSQILEVQSINVFDETGLQIATNSPYTKFQVSTDPEDQSYEFNKLLWGVDYLIQEAQPDDVSGDYHQYIGVTLRTEEGHPNGFVQISITPEKLEEAVVNQKLESILPTIKMGNRGIVFAVDSETGNFRYHPNEKLIGRNAVEYGLSSDSMADEYSGYLTVADERYYASCLDTGDCYVYAAVPLSAVGGKRLPATLSSVFASLAALLIVNILLTVSREERTASETSEKERPDAPEVFDIKMPDGSVKRTLSAAGRLQFAGVDWNNKTPEQKIFMVLKFLLSAFAVIICAAMVMQDSLFDENSVFRFVLSGKWPQGINIFSITGALIIICMVTVVTMALRKLLTMMAKSFGAKGETICRLLHSFVKYGSAIAMLYYCLALFGIDTRTLLASAGILTLVVGLGAQTLVSDILAGLFLIFEGEFQVGDIVTIGDWRGTVIEIGIRTTKIMDGSKNIKVISNSSVSGVINMTREFSYAWVDVGIEYGESLERVENVLEQEFPNIRAHLPAILEGPFYKGVVALADSSVNIRVMVLCAEGDRIQMERDLNREMKLIFDKHNINVPFPQVVINQPVEFQQATEWEKARARKFAEEQRELSGNFIEEDEDR